MDLRTYAVEDAIEADHWWFVARRQLFRERIAALGLPRSAPVLDIGTSTGTNLRLLAKMDFANVRGLDQSEAAIEYCRRKGFTVAQGDVCALPFADAAFDLVLATDIIEHVDDDALAAREIARVLRPGGHALVTVPTFQSLWGLQDDVSQHRRRYRLGQLVEVLSAAGLAVEDAHYFNYLLFAPIWMARQVLRRLPVRPDSENQVNTPLINRVLTQVFTLDIRTAGKVRPPFGVSALAIARRN
jgi:SAM-dependent methyltransferase